MGLQTLSKEAHYIVRLVLGVPPKSPPKVWKQLPGRSVLVGLDEQADGGRGKPLSPAPFLSIILVESSRKARAGRRTLDLTDRVVLFVHK